MGSTTDSQIDEWCNEARGKGATHLIVVCDTFDWTNYPVIVMPSDDVSAMEKIYNCLNEMSRVMEVIDLEKEELDDD